MAYHFNANQYEDKYSPRKLGNWEYPKWYPDRPRQRFKSTKIIADDQGRLLAGIKRENAWGNYVGTWDLPRRITREYVSKLVAPPERLVKLWQSESHVKPTSRPKCENEQPAEKTESKIAAESKCKICENSIGECTCPKVSKTKSSGSALEEVEKCGEPLTCSKCHKDICLCQETCQCNSS